MTENYILNSFPNCDLLKVLYVKTSQRTDIDFNFFGKMDEFRIRVSQEVRQINELFPEYTPHDENYHLSRLFHVADTLLTKERYEAMNSSELFLLALGLYGHDWGMAVSAKEKNFIITGKTEQGTNNDDLWILKDERLRFSRFLRDNKMDISKIAKIDDIDISLWREYVRRTHAERSGEKVRRYFESIDGGVAEALSRVCEGHWLDIEKVSDHFHYPMDFSMLRENVNLRAIAIYVRLIDLLDIAQDRTPYIIWKYVAPRNRYSKMEWKKHRALQPITCPNYQEGRIIRVDGSTDDHEVYAALEDLKNWCESQFKDCSNVLARMNDQRHVLDIYHIDWRVVARGFKPISIQFQFERERMFEILSSEIYKGNPYIFLRELLQNSIDAIRTRRELLRRKKVGTDVVGLITVIVEHKGDGSSLIIWHDDGIGMDEYVVRNYLSVVGKSYYSSPEFESEGLSLDPISKFGVGVLSCFMVANHIEIETYKDPYMPPQSDPLKIIIPDMRQQFRIETISPTEAQPGTTFRIFVEGNKLNSEDDEEPIKQLNVTEYLSYIAGFVDFPIIITEGERKTAIIHPNYKTDVLQKHFDIDSGFEIKQLDFGYPVEEIFYPQDLPNVKECLQEIRYDINKDFGEKDYQGVLTLLVPKEEKLDIVNVGRCWPTDNIDFIEFGSALKKNKNIRWKRGWTNYNEHNHRFTKGKEDFLQSKSYLVYRDGILLENTLSPSPFSKDGLNNDIYDHYWVDASLPISKLIINLPKQKAPKIDIGRTEILGKKEKWDCQVWNSYIQYLSNTKLKEITKLDPFERLIKIAQIVVFEKIPIHILWENFNKDRWPIILLSSQGNIIIKEWSEVSNNNIYITPTLLSCEIIKAFRSKCLGQEYNGFIKKYINNDSVIKTGEILHRFDHYEKYGSVFNIILQLNLIPLKHSFDFGGIRFIQSPFEHWPPLLQEVLVPKKAEVSSINTVELLNKIIVNPLLLKPKEMNILKKEMKNIFNSVPQFTSFSKPFNDYIAYGNQFLNIDHTFSKTLIQCCACILLLKISGKIKDDKIGLLIDYMNNLPFFSYRNDAYSMIKINTSLNNLRTLLLKEKHLDIENIEELSLNYKNFIPGTIIIKEGDNIEFDIDYIETGEIKMSETFGQEIM